MSGQPPVSTISPTQAADALPATDVSSANDVAARNRRLVLIFEVLLAVLVIRQFRLEDRRHLVWLMYLVAGGFVVYGFLPVRWRLPFLVALSLAGFFLILGLQQALIVCAVGFGLIAILQLPLTGWIRAALLIVVAAGLVYCRVKFPTPAWPMLGSMFMFRLFIYARETNARRDPGSLLQRCVYFFMLPNPCFPFFPIVDYRTFCNTWSAVAADDVTQRGIDWIRRGIVHLLLYRVIKYYALPAPHDLFDWDQIALFVVTNYALYLRISGQFHLIVGVMHLFGFNLPRTHFLYFLASSFTDIWRRINVYWKDFLTQQFFFPAFFKLRRWGDRTAILLSVGVVFVATWVLHSWQAFWLVGRFPLTGRDAALWLTAGGLVAVNSLFDYRSAKRPARANQNGLFAAAIKTLQIMGMFLLVSIFWACWTIPRFLLQVSALAREAPPTSHEWASLAGILLAVLATGTALQWLLQQRPRLAAPLQAPPFARSAWATVATLSLLLFVGMPAVHAQLGPNWSRKVADLQYESQSAAEAALQLRGYYEMLVDVDLQSDPIVGAPQIKPQAGILHFTDITRPAGDLRERVLIPGWHGTLAGGQVSINHWGMRNPEVSKRKPRDVTRIAVLGSSVTMGYGVNDDQTFTQRLEQHLNADGSARYEVLNFAVGTYYALQNAVALRKLALDFDPDVVLYIAHQGEAFGVVPHLVKHKQTRYDLPYPCLDRILSEAGVTPETSWVMTERLLERRRLELLRCTYEGIVADCRSRAIIPVWVYLPMPNLPVKNVSEQVMSATGVRLIALARESGLVVVDLSDWADGRRPEEIKLHASADHANAEGHRIIAERLYEALRHDREALPPSRP